MKQVPRLIAIALIFILYAYAKPSSLNSAEMVELAKDFKFEAFKTYSPSNLTPVYVRDVHPQYKNISTWISSVGTSVALFDYDNDKLQNDLVSIDPRFNKVFVSPLPNTKNRFTAFELAPTKCPMNEAVVATGILINDFNEDGNTDVLIFYFGRSPIIFYGTEKRTFIDEELVLNQRYNTATATTADFNGDGHVDIILGNYFPDKSNLYDAKATDKDQIMQHSMSRGDNGANNHIFLWAGIENGKAKFTNETSWVQGLSYPEDWTLAVAAADINNDMLPDLYIANDFGPDKLLVNTTTNGKLSFKEIQGEKKFRTTRSSVIGHDSFKGMGAEFADINNDGLLDIYVSNIADNFALHESHFMFVNTGETDLLKKGLPPFENQSEALGLSRSSWGWDCRIADFNNDGIPEAVQATGFVKGTINRWPELQELATTNDELLTNVKFWPRLVPGDDVSGDAHIPFFVRAKSGKYFDVSAQLGINEKQITRGIAVGDIDHDGKLDFVSSGQWEDSKLYYNKSDNNRGFIGIALKVPLVDSINKIEVDPEKNYVSKFATGAVVKVNLKDGKKLIRFVDGGNGHSGRNSAEIHFSFESNLLQQIENISIEWRGANGKLQQSNIQLTPGWHTVYLPYL